MTSPSERAVSTRGDDLRSYAAEALGTALLLAAIVGSGIVVAQDGAASLQLFAHAVSVGLALAALILTFGPVSGAHFNPVVTLVDAWFGGLTWRRAGGYVVAQVLGAVLGTLLTAVSFGLPVVEIATVARGGGGRVLGEVIATAGLVVVIFGMVRSGAGRTVAGAVGAYIAAAIMFTSSTSFANPAVTVARVLTDSYTGIAPVHVPGFVLGQLAGGIVAAAGVRWMFHPRPVDAAAVVIPHDADTKTSDADRASADRRERP